jgi:hypothetical protein
MRDSAITMKNLFKYTLPLILATLTARAGHTEIRSMGPGAGTVHLRAEAVIPAESDPALTDLKSRALASADFDEDGVPDLVTGYAGAKGGVLSIQRGNVDAIYPNSPEARFRRELGEFTTAAFLPGAKTLTVPEAADLIGAGDFDADGHWDIVTARNGGDKLYWFRGDGHGGFAEPKIIFLPGAITSLITGEMNRADGLTDIAVGIMTQDGAQVLVFESPEGALRGAPESFPLPGAANALAFGQLDDDRTPDLAIASGNEVIIVHGRDRKLSLDEEHRADVKPAEVNKMALDSAVLSIVVGDFAGDSGQELAALTADGRVRVLERGSQKAAEFHTSGAMTLSVATGSTLPTRLLAAKVSSLPKDDLLVFGGTHAVQVLATSTAKIPSSAAKNLTNGGAAHMSVATSLTSDSEVIAVLPMRLNTDALQDLVTVTATGVTPSVLETQAAATYVVNIDGVTNDKTPGDGICADANGNCSFNAALQEADAHPGADTITFNIPGGGVHTLTHGFGQYANEAVTIDGTTQPDGRIEIVASGDYPIVFYGGNSVLRGVATYGSGGAVILPTSGNVVEGNYVGFRADGSKPVGYGANGSGISFQGGTNGSLHGGNNLIGGTTAQARNVISNCYQAVNLGGGGAGNVVRGNYIGTNVAGNAAVPNNGVIQADGTPDVTIGGTTAGAGNLISGNGSANEAINIGLAAAIIQGNFIGTTADGTQPLPNGSTGIYVGGDGTKTVTIGGTTPGARNLIAANAQGILVASTARIQGNYIGTNAAGTGALPNIGFGVWLQSSNSVVGGATNGAGNLISGNADDGVRIGGFYAGGNNVVQGNLIGTDLNGAVAIPNAGDGVEIGGQGSRGNLIGGTSPGARNVISGNRDNGVRLYAGTTNPNRVEGNYIGLNRFGTGALGNGQHGVYFGNQANDIVGGTAPGAGNVIAFNRGAGIASNDAGYGIPGTILSNSIFSNSGLGIDRGGDGVSRYSGTTGEAPIITAINTSGSQTTIAGSLRTATEGGKTPYTIQFFSNSSPDPSGYGEGQTFIGQTTINAGSTEAVPFNATITPAVPPGRYVSAVAVGPSQPQSTNVTTVSSEFSFCARVAGEATPENTPLKINLVLPMLGGDTGSTTVTIVGEGISQGAKVVLRRAGFADIAGQNVEVSKDGSVVSARFNLTGQPRGNWDVVVINSDGTSATATGAYTIENGRALLTGTAILGHGAIRRNRPARYTFICQNAGNNDLYGVPIFVTGIPATAKVTLNFELAPVPRIPGMPADFDPSQVPPVIQTSSGQVIFLIIPILSGKSIRAFEITVEVDKDQGNFRLQVFSTEPLLRTPGGSSTIADLGSVDSPNQRGSEGQRLEVSQAGVNCLTSVLQNVFSCASGIITRPGKACAKAVLSGLNLVSSMTSLLVNSPKGVSLAVSGAQIFSGAISTAFDAGQCTAGALPLGRLVDALSCGLSGASIINDCAPAFTEFFVNIQTAIDPNDKVGTTGSGPEHFVTGNLALPYMIFFENKPAATAAAQEVIITDQLDIAKLDLSTFQLGPISFGQNTVVTPPLGLTEWTRDVDLRPDNNLVVRIVAALDKTTGVVNWHFFSLDPTTMQPTSDPAAGFLPPNVTAPQGDGSVSFSISAKANQATGTQIRNQVHIIFDTNAPIDTPVWLNTIDNSPPTSQVLPLAASQNSTHLQVNWSGSDTGAGITTYTIYVSENGGPYNLWLQNTTLTSAFYDASPNSTVAFYSVATDGAGNTEAAPAVADTTSSLTPSGQLLNIATRLRVQTGDNVLIGGLIITGTDSKKILLRGIGPSLANFGVTNALGDTTLELFQGNTLLQSNDNWKEDQRAEIEATTIPPTNDLESAIVRTLAPGNYTAVLRGKNNLTGIGVVEAYDLDQAANSKFANIATRGFVDTDDNVMIGGAIAGGHNNSGARVLVRAIGPSLTAFGVSGALSDPVLELRNANGMLLSKNDDWRDSQQTEIEATTLAPTNDLESAVVTTLPAGNYTAIVRGVNNTTGVALVEVYNVK